MGMFPPLTEEQKQANKRFLLAYQPTNRRHMYFTTPQRVVDRLKFEMLRTGMSATDVAHASGVPLERVQRLLNTGRTQAHDSIAIFNVFNIEPANFYEELQ